MPTFSIVVTTTRPRLLPAAVRSALAQDDGDFELVISDNSAEGCRALVESFGDPRITYVRPPKYLNVVGHWNFAFSHATGDWQTLLCDDHVFVPRLLSTLRREIDNAPGAETLFWKAAYFFDGDYYREKERFRFFLPRFTGRRTLLDTKQVIEESFASGTGLGGEVKAKIPLIPRAIYSRDVIEKVRERFAGNLFEPFCPMTSCALAALALSAKTMQIDLPMNVEGTPNDSAGSLVADSSTYDRMHQGAQFKHSPLKALRVFPAGAAETVLHVRALMPEEFGHLDLNWMNYFVACHHAIDELAGRGADVTHERALYDEALRDFPSAVQAQVEIAVRRPRRPSLTTRGIRSARTIARRLLPIPRRPDDLFGTLDARTLGLNDILGCADFVDRRIAARG